MTHLFVMVLFKQTHKKRFLLFIILHPFTEYVKKYATEEALRGQENNVSSDSESSMSDFSENEAEDMEL